MILAWLGPYLLRGAARILRRAVRRVRGLGRFLVRLRAYRRLAPLDRRPSARHMQPSLLDETAQTPLDTTYFFQDAWAFERILTASPPEHVDVGSHHKFVSLLSRVMPVTMIDIRPLPVQLPGLNFRPGSITDLPFSDMSLASVSSICVVEHIGLGRYGDPLDPDGTEKAIAELKRVTGPGGNLYLSVPIDDENRTYYDAHRAFTQDYLEELFKPFEIVHRRYIYGNRFTDQMGSGFGTGCYQLRRPDH